MKVKATITLQVQLEFDVEAELKVGKLQTLTGDIPSILENSIRKNSLDITHSQLNHPIRLTRIGYLDREVSF